MNTSYCQNCGRVNSDAQFYCGTCGNPLPNRSTLNQQGSIPAASSGTLERNAILVCCVLSLLVFFLPLMTIQVPIAGAQDISGYDVFSKVSDFNDRLQRTNSYPSPAFSSSSTGNSRHPDLPLSMEVGFLVPFWLIISFISAAIGLITSFKSISASRIMCLMGACFSAAAILHISIMNSDIHSWIAQSMEETSRNLANNPFAGLAEGLGAILATSFQIRAGWGAYALLVLLGLAALIGFSRVLSRLKVVPT